MKEEVLQPIDLAVYLLLKKESVKVEDYGSLVKMLGITTIDDDIRISRIAHDLATTTWVVSKIFTDNRRVAERKNIVINSIKNLIDYGLVLCTLKKDAINIRINDGQHYVDLMNRKEKFITLYFPINMTENYTIVPEKYLNRVIDSCKETKNGRINSIGYYVLLVATIFSHLYYKSVPDGDLLLDIEECFLTPFETKYFTSKKYLWGKVDSVLNEVGIHHQFKRLINPFTSSIITNQYFGIGSEESLDLFVRTKVKILKEETAYTDVCAFNDNAVPNIVLKEKIDVKPKTNVAAGQQEPFIDVFDNVLDDVFDDKPILTNTLIKPDIKPVIKPDMNKVLFDPTAMSEEQRERLRILEENSKRELTDEELEEMPRSLRMAKQYNDEIKKERYWS